MDLGLIASATILPGVLEPVLLDAERGRAQRWVLPLEPVVDDLASIVGGSLLRTDLSAKILIEPLGLDPSWRPDLPLAERLPIEATTLARAQVLTRHRHFFTTTSASTHTTPDQKLAALASLADRLHIDLCCYRFSTVSDEIARPTDGGWHLSFELPADPSPEPRSASVNFADLAKALTEADPLALLNRSQLVKDRLRAVPARYIGDTATPVSPSRSSITVDNLSNRIEALMSDGGGAVAVRRNGTWHFSALVPDSLQTDYRETATGQIREHRIHKWKRATTLSAPEWWGGSIPERICPQCETGTTWIPCDCTPVLGDGPDPLCERCSGTGSRQSSSCTWCGKIGRIRYGYSVTVAGMATDDPVHHFNFDLGTNAEHRPSPPPDFAEMVRTQLPEAARLTTRLFGKGIDLADLRETTGLPPNSSILDAGVNAPEGTPTVDLVHRHTSNVAAGRPGARIFLIWAPPTRATVLQLARIAWGLGLDLVVGAEDRNDDIVAGSALGGMRWGVALLHPREEPDRMLTGAFGKRRLAVAVQACIDHLPHRLNIDANEKPGPLDVVSAPQQTNPPVINGIDDLEPVLSGLASRCRGLVSPTIVGRLSPQRTTFVRLTAGAERRLQPVVPMAEAPTLTEALTMLGRPERS